MTGNGAGASPAFPAASRRVLVPPPAHNLDPAAALRESASLLEEQADAMLARAAHLRAMAEALPPAGGAAGTREETRHLSANLKVAGERAVKDEWRQALALIRQQPNETGDWYAKRIGTSGENFRRRIVPWLKTQGVTCVRGSGGYLPPPQDSVVTN